MKHFLLQLLVLLLAGLLFTGCYTQFNATSQDDEHQAEHVEDGLFEIDSSSYNINYRKMHPFSYYGFGMNPAYQIYYYNPYMWSFHYNSWVERDFWRHTTPSYWEASLTQDASGSHKRQNAPRSTGLWAGVSSVNTRNSDDQIRDRSLANRSDLFVVTSRDGVNLPTLERVAVNEKQRSIRDRRDSDFRERLDRSLSTRSSLTNRNGLGQRSNNSARVQNRTRSNTRSSATVNRSGSSRTSGSSAVRGSSSNRGSSSGNTTRSGSNRSSGDNSSSRGNN